MGPYLKSALSIEEGRPSHERVMRYTGSCQNLPNLYIRWESLCDDTSSRLPVVRSPLSRSD